MRFEEHDVLTGRRGAQFVIRKNTNGTERKVYVFQDPISLEFYNVSSGIVLDTKRYHRDTMASYLWSQRDHSKLLVPHSRREMTRLEITLFSMAVSNYRDIHFGGDVETPYASRAPPAPPVAPSVAPSVTPPVASPVAPPVAPPAPVRARRRLYPRTFTVDISEDVLIALGTVSRWLAEVIEDHGGL
jgi:hypothetical protein